MQTRVISNGASYWSLLPGGSSVQFSFSVVSNSLRPHGLQHARLPCPSPTPRACSNSCPSSWWWHPHPGGNHGPKFLALPPKFLFDLLAALTVRQFFLGLTWNLSALGSHSFAHVLGLGNHRTVFTANLLGGWWFSDHRPQFSPRHC